MEALMKRVKLSLAAKGSRWLEAALAEAEHGSEDPEAGPSSGGVPVGGPPVPMAEQRVRRRSRSGSRVRPSHRSRSPSRLVLPAAESPPAASQDRPLPAPGPSAATGIRIARGAVVAGSGGGPLPKILLEPDALRIPPFPTTEQVTQFGVLPLFSLRSNC